MQASEDEWFHFALLKEDEKKIELWKNVFLWLFRTIRRLLCTILSIQDEIFVRVWQLDTLVTRTCTHETSHLNVITNVHRWQPDLMIITFHPLMIAKQIPNLNSDLPEAICFQDKLYCKNFAQINSTTFSLSLSLSLNLLEDYYSIQRKSVIVIVSWTYNLWHIIYYIFLHWKENIDWYI